MAGMSHMQRADGVRWLIAQQREFYAAAARSITDECQARLERLAAAHVERLAYLEDAARAAESGEWVALRMPEELHQQEVPS